MVKNLYQWWIFLEQENVESLRKADDAQDKPSHTKTLRDSLKINPATLIGTTIPYSGILGDKQYNMVGLVVVGFDDNENPTRVKLNIMNQSPNMDADVRFKGGDTKVSPDEGTIDISLEEFDKILSKGWEPAIQGQGGMGMGMGMPGGGPLGM